MGIVTLPQDPPTDPRGERPNDVPRPAKRAQPLGMGSWFCMACDESGQSARFDKDAEKHTKATGHGTVTSHRDPAPLAACIAEVRQQLEKRRA